MTGMNSNAFTCFQPKKKKKKSKMGTQTDMRLDIAMSRNHNVQIRNVPDLLDSDNLTVKCVSVTSSLDNVRPSNPILPQVVHKKKEVIVRLVLENTLNFVDSITESPSKRDEQFIIAHFNF